MFTRKVSIVEPYNHTADSNKDKSSKSKMQTACEENLRQYLMNSTLHGLRYVGTANITLFERCVNNYI